MTTSRWPMTLGLSLVLAGSLTAGCAGRHMMSGKTMCESHGATYSSASKQCTYPAQQPPRNIAQICQTQGGTWDPVGEHCVLDYTR